MRAFVFIRADPGKAKAVAEAVAKIEGVKASYAITGRFDVIAEVEAADPSALGELVLAKIQGVEGVRSTETSFVV